MRVAKRIPPIKKSARGAPAKIPNPLPRTAGGPQCVEGGCIFRDMKANCAPPPSLFEKLPPLLKNPVGRVILPTELREMRELRKKSPEKWTITALSGKFNIARSFIINKVLAKAEQKIAEEELAERIDSLSFKEKRGWLQRYKIREHRRDLW